MSNLFNIRVVFKILGLLLLIESAFILISALVGLLYYEKSAILTGCSALITAGVGGISLFFTRNSLNTMGKREGYVIVSLVWVIFSLFGALPYYLNDSIPTYTDSFFETMSGFTTTGASILNDIEVMPKNLLFCRSLTQWLGGMGIIVLSLAILPMLGIGGMQLFVAEVPGPTPDKLHPRVKETAKRLWGIYLIFTLAETILLLFGGMDFFDSINHAFTTMATGGYSTKQASIAYYDSAYIHYVIIVFMFIAGTNFTLSYFAFKRQFDNIWKNEEFRFYLGITISFTLIISSVLWFTSSDSIEKSFRDSLFQVVSIITTTGFATADYLRWTPPFLWVLIFSLMFFGGSAGSTGGGIKVVRILLLFKNSALEFRRLVHPSAVLPVRLNTKAVHPSIITNVYAFIVIYMLSFFLGTVIMTILGLDLDTAMGAVATTLGNVGPGLGSLGPADNFYQVPDAGKWLLSFLMLVGRLELFTVYVLFAPSFWKR